MARKKKKNLKVSVNRTRPHSGIGTHGSGLPDLAQVRPRRSVSAGLPDGRPACTRHSPAAPFQHDRAPSGELHPQRWEGKRASTWVSRSTRYCVIVRVGMCMWACSCHGVCVHEYESESVLDWFQNCHAIITFAVHTIIKWHISQVGHPIFHLCTSSTLGGYYSCCFILFLSSWIWIGHVLASSHANCQMKGECNLFEFLHQFPWFTICACFSKCPKMQCW